MPHTIGGVAGRLVIRDLALADGTPAQLQLGIAVVIEDGPIQWLGPTEEADSAGTEVMDRGGATLRPRIVAGHSRPTAPGASHSIRRFFEPASTRPQGGGG